jgi:gas vesicle protein
MSKKDTLNIYEVLEILNDKINANTSLIEKTNLDTLDSISEIKSYLLEKLKSNIEDTQKSIKKRMDRFEIESNKKLDEKQRKLVSNEFTNLQNNISKDMEDLVERIMNSRIL